MLEKSIKKAPTESENVLFNKIHYKAYTPGMNIPSLCSRSNSGNIHYVEVLLLQKK